MSSPDPRAHDRSDSDYKPDIKKKLSEKMGANRFSPADRYSKKVARPIIKNAKKTGKRVCTTCGKSISHQEEGEDTCNSCA